MKRRSVLLIVVVAGACQQEDAGPARDQPAAAAAAPSAAKPAPGAPSAAPALAPGGPIDPAYARDVDRLCDVIAKSGAAELPVNDRTFRTATWLAKNFETSQARALLVRIGPLDGAAKADALDAEAKRVGLARCPLANDWRGFHP